MRVNGVSRLTSSQGPGNENWVDIHWTCSWFSWPGPWLEVMEQRMGSRGKRGEQRRRE
jgi:hypothetical protein